MDFYASYDTNISTGDIYLGSDYLGSISAYTYYSLFKELRLPASVSPGTYYVGWIETGANGEYGGMNYCGGWRANCNSYGVIATPLTVTSDSGFNWTVNASGDGNGSMSPSTRTVEDGFTASFTLSANPGYAIDWVDSNCGGSLSGTTFTTDAVHADCSIQAHFADRIFGDGFDPIN